MFVYRTYIEQLCSLSFTPIPNDGILDDDVSLFPDFMKAFMLPFCHQVFHLCCINISPKKKKKEDRIITDKLVNVKSPEERGTRPLAKVLYRLTGSVGCQERMFQQRLTLFLKPRGLTAGQTHGRLFCSIMWLKEKQKRLLKHITVIEKKIKPLVCLFCC